MKVYLHNCAYKIVEKQMTGLSRWKCFWKLDVISAELRWIDISETIFLKVTTVKIVWFTTIVFLIMDSTFNIMYVMTIIIWQC